MNSIKFSDTFRRLFAYCLVWAANDPQQPESASQERSTAFAGAILIERSGIRLANEPAIRAQPNAHRLRSSAASICLSFFESDGIALSWRRISALRPLARVASQIPTTWSR